MTAKNTHIHKFKRLKYKSGNITFFCTLPDCNTKLNPALALGKRSICWRCGNPFIISEYALRLAKPHCESCHKSKGIPWVHEPTETDKIAIEELRENLSLSDRLQQTIQNAQQQTIEQEEDEL